MALAVEAFREEVKDKLSVVFHGCHSTPLERALSRQQCEDFLVECYTATLRENERLKTALEKLPFGPHVERNGHMRLTYWAADVNAIKGE